MATLNIVMGVSGSGKTHFIEHNFKGWKHFSVGEYQQKLKKERIDSGGLDIFERMELLVKANKQIIYW